MSGRVSVGTVLRRLGDSLPALSQARNPDDPFAQWRFVTALAIGLCLATSALVGFGYVATRGWEQSTTSVIEGRATEALALLGVALNRDMKGAWTTVLVPTNLPAIEEDPPYTMLQSTARAFATFPYPESFLTWKASADGNGVVHAFNRPERWPIWDHSVPPDDPFPVVIVQDPPALMPVVAALRELPEPQSGFTSIDVDIEGVRYQVVAHLLFATSEPRTLLGLAAFTVSIPWITREYFGPLLTQIGRIGSGDGGLWFAVADDQGRTVATTSSRPPGGREFERHFDMLFLESALVPEMPAESAVRQWTVKVRPSGDSRLLAGLQEARRTFAVLAIAGILITATLLLIVRAVRARAVATSMKSDFVSEVTHELKTPLAFIRFVGDTVAGHRYSSQEELEEYAGLLSQEASRLGESINSLLTYARYGDPNSTSQITMAPAPLNDLIEAALERFRPALVARGFDLIVDVPADMRLLVDTRSMIQVFEAVIDNAIKYSGELARLHITGRRESRHVVVTFADRGIGIPEDDIKHVFNRFYRAGNAASVGSGLGLTIARSIVRRHGGTMTLHSTVDVGTNVEIRLKMPPI
jgi:signal transduction histidine kinase